VLTRVDNALAIHRLHFAFTVAFTKSFPNSPWGIALLMVILKTLALTKKNAHYDQCARFRAKIFAINSPAKPRFRNMPAGWRCPDRLFRLPAEQPLRRVQVNSQIDQQFARIHGPHQKLSTGQGESRMIE
jgi:hypothetical protein